MEKNNLNHEGYHDPTAYLGIKEAEKEILAREKEIGRLMEHIKYVTSLAGFEVCSRIVFKDKRDGKYYK